MESLPQNRTLVRMLIRISAVVLRTLGLTGCKLLGSGRSYLGGIGCMLTNSNCLYGLINDGGWLVPAILSDDSHRPSLSAQLRILELVRFGVLDYFAAQSLFPKSITIVLSES